MAFAMSTVRSAVPIPPYSLLVTADKHQPPYGIELCGWKIWDHKAVLSKSDAMDAFHAASGVKPPELAFLENGLTLSHAASGLTYTFDAKDSLKPCRHATATTAAATATAAPAPAAGATAAASPSAAAPAAAAAGAGASASASTSAADSKSASAVSEAKAASAGAASGGVKVQSAKQWTNKNMGEIDLGYDWTYTTDYKGLISTAESAAAAGTATHGQAVEAGAAAIDMDMLRRTDIPILWNDEVTLWEDELHDNGVSKLTLKIRVMPVCVFVLLRFFLRVDGVLIRVRDTRLFHAFGTASVVREYTERESTFDALTRAGLPSTPKHYADPNLFLTHIRLLRTERHRIDLKPTPAAAGGTGAAAAAAAAAK